MHKNNRLFSTLTAGYYLTWVKLMVVMAIISIVVSCGDEAGVSPRVEISPAAPGQVGEIITSAGLTNIAVKWAAPTNFGVKSNYMTDVIQTKVVTNDGKVTTNVTTESVKRDVMYTITDIGYKVTISPSNANVFKQEIDLTNVSFAGLASNTSYTITVWATNPKASGPQTRKIQKTRATLANPPSAPVVTVSNGTPAQSSLVVNWSAPTDPGTNQTGVLAIISGYLVAVSTNANPDGSGVVGFQLVTNAPLSATFSNLTGDTQYYIAVFATNSVALNSMGFATYRIPSLATPSSRPLSVVATPSTTSMVVSWTAPANSGKDRVGNTATIANYLVGISTTPNASGAVGSQLVAANDPLSATFSGLKQEKIYFIGVIATNSAGLGSSPGFTIRRTRATPADAPTGVTTGSITANTIVVNWTASTGATGYKVQWKTGSATYGTAVRVTGGTTTTYTITGLTGNTPYDIQVIAVKANADDSSPSTALQATTLSVASAPGAVSITMIGSNANSVTVTWNAGDTGNNADGSAATITGYDVDIVLVTGTGTAPVPASVVGTGFVNGATATARVVSGLSPNTEYRITVKALNVIGTSTGTDVAITTGS